MNHTEMRNQFYKLLARCRSRGNVVPAITALESLGVRVRVTPEALDAEQHAKASVVIEEATGALRDANELAALAAFGRLKVFGFIVEADRMVRTLPTQGLQL